MLMFWNTYYRWILFIGALVLLGVGNLCREPSTMSVSEREGFKPIVYTHKGNFTCPGWILASIGALLLLAWIATFIGVTF